MADANSAIDEYLKKERQKKFGLYLVILLFVVLLIMAFVAYSTGITSEVSGTVTAIHSTADESRESFNIVVELESSNIIYIEAPREAHIKKGDAVKLLERKTNLFGFTSYIFKNVEK